MGKAASFCIFAVMIMACAGTYRPAWGSPAMPAMIAEVLAALDKGDAQHAQSMADAALREDGISAGERGCLLLYRGLAWELLGAHDAAMADFTHALDTRALPADAREQALLQRGFLRDGLGQLEEATRDYSAVIALKGYSFVTALNNRANIYRRQNRLKEARRDYVAALSAGGGKPQYSYYGLGQIAEAQHDTALARGFYAKAASADPDYAAASERLVALGGPADGTIPEQSERIVLRPPPSLAASEAPLTRPADKAGAPQGTVHTVPVALHSHRPDAGRPAPSGPVHAVALRPALDQPRAPASEGAEVQLGAWRSAAEADAGWNRAKVQAGGMLDGLRPHVLAIDLPGRGRYFRLRVSPGPGQGAAEICSSLAARDVACLPVRN